MITLIPLITISLVPERVVILGQLAHLTAHHKYIVHVDWAASCRVQQVPPDLISRFCVALVMTGLSHLYMYIAVFRGLALFSIQTFVTIHILTTIASSRQRLSVLALSFTKRASNPRFNARPAEVLTTPRSFGVFCLVVQANSIIFWLGICPISLSKVKVTVRASCSGIMSRVL